MREIWGHFALPAYNMKILPKQLICLDCTLQEIGQQDLTRLSSLRGQQCWLSTQHEWTCLWQKASPPGSLRFSPILRNGWGWVFFVQYFAVGWCSCCGWFADSGLNRNVTRSLSLKHLWPLNKGPPLKFGYLCSRISRLLSSLLLHPTDL